METAKYFELKSVEKDGLPKEGFEFYTSKGLLYFYSKNNPNNDYGEAVFSCNMERISPECPEWYFEPISLPTGRKTAEEIKDEARVWAIKNYPTTGVPEEQQWTLAEQSAAMIGYINGYENAPSSTQEGSKSEKDMIIERDREAVAFCKSVKIAPKGIVYNALLHGYNFAMNNHAQFRQPNIAQEGMKEDAIQFNYWCGVNGFRFIQQGNFYLWRSESLNIEFKNGKDLYDLYQSQKQK